MRHGNSERETFWQGVIRGQEVSGLSISAFCRMAVASSCRGNAMRTGWVRFSKHCEGRRAELLASNKRVPLHGARRHEEEFSRLVPVGRVRIEGGPGIGAGFGV